VPGCQFTAGLPKILHSYILLCSITQTRTGKQDNMKCTTKKWNKRHSSNGKKKHWLKVSQEQVV